jgi:hypothetical protein
MPQGLTIALLLQIVTNCSSDVASKAELAICKTPEAITTLGAACAVSGYAIHAGNTLFRVGAAEAATGVGSMPGVGTMAAGVAAGLVGAAGVRRFCFSAVKQVTDAVGQAVDLQRIDPNSTTILQSYQSPSDSQSE